MDEKDLESRVSKIEEHIKYCEKTKDKQWKDDFITKLDGVKDGIGVELQKQNKKNTRNSQLIAFGNLGVVSVVFASHVQGFVLTPTEALAFLIGGALLYFISWSYIPWEKLGRT